MRFTYMTPSVERLPGYTPNEASALELEELLTPDSLERVRATLSSGLESAAHGDTLGLRVTEVDQHRKDGSIVATEVATRFLPTPDGRPHVVLGITRDIAERKLAQGGLRKSEERYRVLSETSPDLIFVIDSDDRVVYVNGAAAKSLNGTAEEIYRSGARRPLRATELRSYGASAQSCLRVG